MRSIVVNNLQKTFQAMHEAAGFNRSLRTLFRTEYGPVEALGSFSFHMESGELPGFIDLNGVGKSTAISDSPGRK
jgi:ABC-type uncharacterized transport system ATPase subunit